MTTKRWDKVYNEDGGDNNNNTENAFEKKKSSINKLEVRKTE